MLLNDLTSEMQTGITVLEESYRYLRNPKSVKHGMDLLSHGLALKKKEFPKKQWRFFCREICLSHPIRNLLHQDPVTLRSFSKPRGYPGDAVLLDFLYQHPSIKKKVDKITQLGKAIFEYQISRPSAQSVRWRRQYLAQLIDEISTHVPQPEILSVACGHLREAKHSHAVQHNLVKRIVAFDQDTESLKTIKAEQGDKNIECVQGKIKDLIKGKTKLGKFDFIYSAGLYDYLSDDAARQLTRALFGMLKENGRLLIANFLPDNTDSGYMEAFMGWQLLYRSKEQFEKIAEPLKDYLQRIVFDDNRCVLYLEFKKRKAK